MKKYAKVPMKLSLNGLLKVSKTEKRTTTRRNENMNKLDIAISNSKHSKPYYHKIIIDLLVQLATSGKYRSLTSFKQSSDKLTAEQKETLKRYTDSIICMLEIGMTFHEIKEFLSESETRA